MKSIIKLSSVILALIIVLSIGTVGCKKGGTEDSGVAIDQTFNYEALPGNLSTYLDDNPDRGYRTEMSLNIKE